MKGMSFVIDFDIATVKRGKWQRGSANSFLLCILHSIDLRIHSTAPLTIKLEHMLAFF